MNQQPPNNSNGNGNDNPLILALLSMLVGNGNASNNLHGAQPTETAANLMLGQSQPSNPNSTQAATATDFHRLLSIAQRNAGNSNSRANNSTINNINNGPFQGNAGQLWQPNPAPRQQQQHSKPSQAHQSELSIALANATCMLTAPGAARNAAAASGSASSAAPVNSLSNARGTSVKSSVLGSNGTAAVSSNISTKSPVLRTAPANDAKSKGVGYTDYRSRTNHTGSITNSTHSATNSANSTNSSSMSQGNKLQTKTMVIPCHARGMTMHHNFRTAYFNVPEDVEHGYNLVCSYADCQNRGVKFRWCSTCVAPVASRSFLQKHTHPAQQSSSNESDETEASSTGRQSDQAVAYSAGSASSGSRLSSSSDCNSSSSSNSSQKSASGSSGSCARQELPWSKDATPTRSAPSAEAGLETADGGQQDLSSARKNGTTASNDDDGESNPWDSSQARQNWMDLLHQRPLDSDPEAVSNWLGRVMATCTHQQMVSEESSDIPGDGANSRGLDGRSMGQNTASTSSSSDDTTGSEDSSNSKESSWGGSESSSGGGGNDQADAEEEGEIVTANQARKRRVAIYDPKGSANVNPNATSRRNHGDRKQGGGMMILAAAAGAEARRTTATMTTTTTTMEQQPAPKKPRNN